MAVEFVDIHWRGKPFRIEHEWIAPERTGQPLLVFLHEGLGSRSMWRDFPRRLCAAGRYRGLVYSRPGYGRSSPRRRDERWDVDFMHRQAHDVLPALLRALAVAQAPWLFGHSDGASIALLYASRFAEATAGVIALAPHLFVEELSLASIRRTREAFTGGDLPQRLARHHDDVESAFWGWHDIWLHEPFRHWNIEAELAAIRCPVLAMQGVDDEYGTLQQIRSVQARLPGTQLLEMPNCGHSPQRDQPERVITASVDFIAAAQDPAIRHAGRAALR